MSKTVETKVYEYSELSEAAKEKARAWLIECMDSADYADHIIDEAARELEETYGVTVDTHPVQLMSGKTRQDPSIFFSGFWSQGDGASFTGKVDLAKWMRAQKIAGTYRTLYNAAVAGNEGRGNGYEVEAVIKRYSDAHYVHANTIYAEVIGYNYDMDDTSDRYDRAVHQETVVRDLLTAWARDYARQIYRDLQTEYEYQTSEEQIADSMDANEYTFTERGERFG